ncbi:polysaccharide ABC transporter ATP-binding protein [Jejudonia soesokkakensis]|uniref:Polysaccharide ABC transporter ATP-binding protein n=1 Tax=Jejudonia soesokkakensis TaxID=1323432 RepID=A0ABW2MU59_9FLAO
MGVILKVENISKQYRLGTVGTGTIAHDLNRWWHAIRGKEDPYLKIGSVNDRNAQPTEEYVWALKDINFEVKAGEVLGIIGKNGAGKSTLLKLLSRVTSPTTGVIKSKGRIASLLEVGTGFHPELTGRENIYLNGAILGMTKAEIASKIDEIVDFSGCELYIDTPTKRYSSGMTVRLAFAVAAHLEPDILVVDEVLAVGDAEFQKKAIGKMQEISGGKGRTVLFVSHNMASVATLCTRGIVLQNGSISFNGDVNQAISSYLLDERGTSHTNVLKYIDNNIPEKNGVKLLKAIVSSDLVNTNQPIKIDDEIFMICEIEVNDTRRNINIGFQFLDSNGNVIFMSQTRKAQRPNNLKEKPGLVSFIGKIPKEMLNEGEFIVNIYVVEGTQDVLILVKDLLTFNVLPMARREGERLGKNAGIFKTNFPWEMKVLDIES